MEQLHTKRTEHSKDEHANARCCPCILANRECKYSDERCQSCQKSVDSGNTSSPYLSCQKTNIFRRSSVAFGELVELSDTTWRFLLQGRWWEASVNYSFFFGSKRARQLAIQDLTAFTPTDDSQNSQLDGIAKFVEQFRNVEDRWLDIYSESAEQVVRCVSEYLNVLLNRDNPLKDDYEPLISALRCLVMSHNFKMFDTNYRPGWISKRGRDKSKKVFGRSEIELGRTGQLTLSPEIVLLRRPKDSPDDEHRKGESDSFCYQLAKAIESTEKMLLRGSPRDWPTVIFSCSILALVYNNLPEMEDYTRVFWPLRGGLYRAMQELSSLYLFCCGDMHPLNQKFDIHWFRLMVGGDSLAIQHYEAMNKQWLEFIEGLNKEIPIHNSKVFFMWLEGMMAGSIPLG